MTDTELRRQEIIDELKSEVTKELIEILYEIYQLNYRDNMYDNTISEQLVFNCDSITRSLDSYRRRLDELNGYNSGNYPWAWKGVKLCRNMQ